jgi:hypothetical protein
MDGELDRDLTLDNHPKAYTSSSLPNPVHQYKPGRNRALSSALREDYRLLSAPTRFQSRSSPPARSHSPQTPLVMPAPPAKKAKVAPSPLKFHEDFNDPEADVILRCVAPQHHPDYPTLFAVRRSNLIAASSVFEDMFGLPQSVEAFTSGEDSDKRSFEGQKAAGVLPVVKLTDHAEYMGVVLRLIHRAHVSEMTEDIRPSSHMYAVEDLVGLLAIADKYDMPTVTTLVSLALEEYAAEPDSGITRGDHERYLAALAAGIIFKRPEVVSKALCTWWDACSMWKAGGEDIPPFYDIDQDLFVKVPVHAIRAILKIEASLRVSTEFDKKGRWLDISVVELAAYMKYVSVLATLHLPSVFLPRK